MSSPVLDDPAGGVRAVRCEGPAKGASRGVSDLRRDSSRSGHVHRHRRPEDTANTLANHDRAGRRLTVLSAIVVLIIAAILAKAQASPAPAGPAPAGANVVPPRPDEQGWCTPSGASDLRVPPTDKYLVALGWTDLPWWHTERR
ncbi:hypothetical protein GCM10009592_09640 [Brachybacterium rhamnosum]